MSSRKKGSYLIGRAIEKSNTLRDENEETPQDDCPKENLLTWSFEMDNNSPSSQYEEMFDRYDNRGGGDEINEICPWITDTHLSKQKSLEKITKSTKTGGTPPLPPNAKMPYYQVPRIRTKEIKESLVDKADTSKQIGTTVRVSPTPTFRNENPPTFVQFLGRFQPKNISMSPVHVFRKNAKNKKSKQEGFVSFDDNGNAEQLSFLPTPSKPKLRLASPPPELYKPLYEVPVTMKHPLVQPVPGSLHACIQNTANKANPVVLSPSGLKRFNSRILAVNDTLSPKAIMNEINYHGFSTPQPNPDRISNIQLKVQDPTKTQLDFRVSTRRPRELKSQEKGIDISSPRRPSSRFSRYQSPLATTSTTQKFYSLRSPDKKQQANKDRSAIQPIQYMANPIHEDCNKVPLAKVLQILLKRSKKVLGVIQ